MLWPPSRIYHIFPLIMHADGGIPKYYRKQRLKKTKLNTINAKIMVSARATASGQTHFTPINAFMGSSSFHLVIYLIYLRIFVYSFMSIIKSNIFQFLLIFIFQFRVHYV